MIRSLFHLRRRRIGTQACAAICEGGAFEMG